MATPPDFSPGQVLTAAHMDAVGLWLVKTQTIGTAVTTQNVTSCFSADYDNYVITVSGVSVSANGGTLNYKLLSGTTPTASGFYGNTYYVVTAAAGGLTNAPFSNTNYGEFLSSTTSSQNYGRMEIQAPFASQWTRSQSFGADNNYVRWNSMVHQSNTSYDGIQILPNTGTMTGGTIRVYGYRN